LLAKFADDRWDIVLTGNAGDGKTHLLRQLQQRLGSGAHEREFVFDASQIILQENAAPIVDAWQRARSRGERFFLAINEYPLHLLRRFADKTGNALPALAEIKAQCRHRLIYTPGETPEDALTLTGDRTLVIDLSLRNPLHPEFAGLVLDRLLQDSAIAAEAQHDPHGDLALNLRALLHSKVRERLFDLQRQLTAGGRRVTVRDLWITLTRLLFPVAGDPPMARGDFRLHYSTRLFATSDPVRIKPTRLNLLLDALADPADQSHPHWDARLESTGARDGTRDADWLVTGREPASDFVRDTMRQREPKARALFEALKRRFYFEHRCGEESFALRGSALQRFAELLDLAREHGRKVLRDLLGLINRAYCPHLSDERERLHLWVGHRRYVQPSRAWFADRAVPVDRFALLIPRLPHRIAGATSYEPDHLLLRLREIEVTLRIDFNFFQRLASPADSRSRREETVLERVDNFLLALVPPTILKDREILRRQKSGACIASPKNGVRFESSATSTVGAR